jgi:hypothetical protein
MMVHDVMVTQCGGRALHALVADGTIFAGRWTCHLSVITFLKNVNLEEGFLETYILY